MPGSVSHTQPFSCAAAKLVSLLWEGRRRKKEAIVETITADEMKANGLAYTERRITEAKTEAEKAKWKRVRMIIEGRPTSEIYPS